MSNEENPVINAELREMDAEQIRNGHPILSVMVQLEDGQPCSVTFESIRKYGLAKPGETIEATIVRLIGEAHEWAKFSVN